MRMLLVLAVVRGASHARPAAAEDRAAGEPAAAADVPPFQPGDISIGEPLQLPLGAAETVLPAPVPPTVKATPDAGRFRTPRDPAATAADTFRGEPAGRTSARESGWLGFAVDDSLVTGRLVVVDVAEKSPAARAGVRQQDVLLAIDGEQLRTADQLAAALAAITPGQEVKVALGRPDRIDEVVLLATARPPEAITRDWQAANPSQPTLQPSRTAAASAFSAGDAPAPADLPPPSVTVPAAAPSLRFDSAGGLTRDAGSTAGAELRPSPGPHVTAGNSRGRTALGVRTLPVDPGVQARFRLSEPAGALVIGVVHDLPASKAGVPPGSVIVALDNQPVRSPNELTALVANGPTDKPVLLQYVLPGGEARRAEVSLQSLELPLERALIGPSTPVAAPPPALLSPSTARRIAHRPDERSRAATQAAATQATAATAVNPVAPVHAELQRLKARLEALERQLDRMR
jgi:S1-C subfamily serine protease